MAARRHRTNELCGGDLDKALGAITADATVMRHIGHVARNNKAVLSVNGGLYVIAALPLHAGHRQSW